MANFLRAILILTVAVAALSGCSKTKTDKTNTTNRGSVTPPTTGQSVGECNRFSLPTISLDGHVGTFYDPSTRQFRQDMINVNFKTTPAQLANDDNFSISFYRWYARVAGQKNINNIPVTLYYMDKLTGRLIASSPADKVNKAAAQNALNQLGMTSVTLSQFFERFRVILIGMDFSYDAVEVRVMSGVTLAGFTNALLPPYYVDPNFYMSYNPVPELYTLHPFYAYASSGGTQADYLRMANAICQELAGIGTRVPASVADAVEPQLGFFARIWVRLLDTLDHWFF